MEEYSLGSISDVPQLALDPDSLSELLLIDPFLELQALHRVTH